MDISYLGRAEPIIRFGPIVTLYTPASTGIGYDVVDHHSLELHKVYESLYIWNNYSRDGVLTSFVFTSPDQKYVAQLLCGVPGIGAVKAARIVHAHGDAVIDYIRRKNVKAIAQGVTGVSPATAGKICDAIGSTIRELWPSDSEGTEVTQVEKRDFVIQAILKIRQSVNEALVDKILYDHPEIEIREAVEAYLRA